MLIAFINTEDGFYLGKLYADKMNNGIYSALLNSGYNIEIWENDHPYSSQDLGDSLFTDVDGFVGRR